MKKNVFLYVVIAVLAVALVGLGALNVRSLNKLESLQSKVSDLQKNVQEVSDSAAELSSKADQLDALYADDPTVESAAAAASPDSQDSSSQEQNSDSSTDSSASQESAAASQEEGTLSPSSGSSTFTDNSDSSMDNVLSQVQSLLPTDNGTWSVYVCNLAKNTEGAINDQKMQAASLIKLYIMGAVYEDYDSLSTTYGKETLDNNLNSMITVSDNESFNELVRLQTTSGVFKDGAEAVNAFLAESQFADTSVQHTLSPSASKDAGLGGRNTTSVKDCGELLSRIYKGECVSKEASEAMLNLLLNQQVTTKIPSGISASVEIANKTGETDTDQHDIAIVYGEKTTYILCVMSENCKSGDAVSHIRDISGIVYNYLNMRLDQD